MRIIKYPDGTSYVTIPKEWEDTHQEITFKINNYEELIHLAQLCDVLIHNRVTAHITIPNMLDAQADRRFNEFHSTGLKVVARVLEPYNEKGISFGIFHPHNAEVVEALFSSVEIIDNSNFVNKILISLADKTSPTNTTYVDKVSKNLILMSVDAGGFKPLSKLCDTIGWKGKMYSASKARSWDEQDGTKFIQQIDREDFEGKDILIIDDISVRGGTFKGLSKLLKERNCGKLYLAVSHMTVQNLGVDPVTNYFDKVFTTNSKYDEYFTHQGAANRYQPKNLEIIKMFKDESKL